MATHVVTVTVTPAEVAAARALIRLSGKDNDVDDKVNEALARLAGAETRPDSL
jgi:hypothetical protein